MRRDTPGQAPRQQSPSNIRSRYNDTALQMPPRVPFACSRSPHRAGTACGNGLRYVQFLHAAQGVRERRVVTLSLANCAQGLCALSAYGECEAHDRAPRTPAVVSEHMRASEHAQATAQARPAGHMPHGPHVLSRHALTCRSCHACMRSAALALAHIVTKSTAPSSAAPSCCYSPVFP